MATYKETKGVTILTKDGDPDVFAGTWASGGNLNRNSRQFASFGTLTAGVVAGGAPGTVPSSAEVEEYNGTAWSEVNNMNTGKNMATSAGDSGSNALANGGSRGSPNPAATQTEIWNGTSWTELNDYATNRNASQATGAISMSSAILAGGEPRSAVVEEWNAPLANKTITSS